MIPAGTSLTLRRIPTVEVRLTANHNRETLNGPLAYFYETLCAGADVAPILVRQESLNCFELRDGKKRWISHVLAGRPTVLAVVMES